MFRKVLVANRGEIALRIMRTLREMGVTAVGVYSDADRKSPHVAFADEAYRLGPAPVAESYLDADRILRVAERCGAEAVIPGYGFLSENAGFARACGERGLTFVGPSPEAIEVMGLKPRAREHMEKAGVPVVPGGPAASREEAEQTARRVGFPVMLKAAAGGGGRGMRRVDTPAQLPESFERARSEAQNSFGDGTIYVEKLVVSARHVEVQVLGDTRGNLVHLFERDCSVQRRHQKVIEESPSPRLSRQAAQRLCETALRGARSVSYHSAGTFEFLVDREENFYFLEMNTRLQVEHPVTELLTGVDLVREMLRVAAGEALGYEQAQIVARGAAIECRIYAEDPARGFLPSPGTIESLAVPEGPGIRHDCGVVAGQEMSFAYDAMAAKLCVWASSRPHALDRMRRALGEYSLEGVQTNLEFLRRAVVAPAFVSGDYHTGFIEENALALLGEVDPPVCEDRDAARAVLVAARQLVAPAPAAASGARGASPWQLTQRRRSVGS